MYRALIDKASEILLVVAASMTPSSTLLPYIEYFISTLASDVKERCLFYFTQCKQIGSRVELCNCVEIDALIVVSFVMCLVE